MGLTDRDADGYRLRPDGKRLAFTIEFSNSNTGEKTSGLELIAEQWREVGVDAALKAISNDLVRARTLANQMEVGVWGRVQRHGHQLHHRSALVGAVHYWLGTQLGRGVGALDPERGGAEG